MDSSCDLGCNRQDLWKGVISPLNFHVLYEARCGCVPELRDKTAINTEIMCLGHSPLQVYDRFPIVIN